MVQGFDGNTLWFNASQDQLERWKRDSVPDYDEYSNYKTQESPAYIETRIPLIEERLNVSKRTYTSEATITKEPATETRTVSDTVRSEKIDTSGSKEE
ncbi:MAG: YsnF/AvaK domain-containing protein [Thermoproteota archaeon]|nr:YsnF/AvaK domain-containing protein [Thermoproteota archaeon]